jgi:hypothetical protein
MNSKVLGVLEEQIVVGFTGKVNILATYNRQFLGHILFKNGEILQVLFDGQGGLKAFYRLIIQEHLLKSFDYVVEPEVVEDKERQIHYPYAVIKNKLQDVIQKHQEYSKHRPPDNIKIIIDGAFLKETTPVTPQEFTVLETLTEWSNPYEIYQNCDLMDYEITGALISLRKKGALKTLAPRPE